MESTGTARDLSPGTIPFDAERIAHDRRGLWIAGVVELIGLAAFVALFNLILPPFDRSLAGLPLIGIGLLMSLAPALLWMLFFYRFDRLDPEPKHGVFTIFAIAALLTVAVAQPALKGFFEIDAWLYRTWWTHLLGGVLVVGIVQTFVIYATVRYGVYFRPEFDERVDGPIYGVAAGLGVATALNFAYIIAHGGVDLDVGSMRMVINALAYASFGGVLGYFLGQTRFEKTPFYYLPAGFLLAAVLNGFFFFMEDQVTATGLQSSPRNGLILAAIFALVVLGLLFWLIQRANEETLRLARAPQPPEDGGFAAVPPPVYAPAAPPITEPEPAAEMHTEQGFEADEPHEDGDDLEETDGAETLDDFDDEPPPEEESNGARADANDKSEIVNEVLQSWRALTTWPDREHPPVEAEDHIPAEDPAEEERHGEPGSQTT